MPQREDAIKNMTIQFMLFLSILIFVLKCYIIITHFGEPGPYHTQ